MFSGFYKATIGIVLMVFLTGCGVTNPTSKGFTHGNIPQASIPPQADIAKTRKAIYQELGQKNHFKLYSSGADYQRVKPIINRLSRAASLGNFSYPVIIADAKGGVNAMAVNGNTIVVYSELLRRVPGNDELAAVLAHEVSHIIDKHHTDNTAQQRDILVQIGAGILGTVVGDHVHEAAGGLTEAVAGTIGQGLFVKSYSRAMEYEADHTGMLLMAKAGYDPRAALRFWADAKRIFGSTSGNDFLSTHPSATNRQQQLQETLPLAMKYYNG